jgi:hypothetical protein
MNARRILTTRRLTAVAALSAALAVSGAFGIQALDSAAAATNALGQQRVSANWAGYVVRNPTGSQTFSSVSGSWVEPSATGNGYSSFWVGIGGAGQSHSLEQIGTEANVVNGQVRYDAWYELPPEASVPLSLAINPGDHISAAVTVNGTNVTVSLSDRSTGGSFTKTLQMSNPDTSSAEWIAEAPSAMSATGSLRVLPLANFGTVTFTDAFATADGHTGPISDPHWTADAFKLTSAGLESSFAGVGGPTPLGGGSAAGAVPSQVASNGSSFSVSWVAASRRAKG